MFNLNDIIGSVTDFMNNGVADSEALTNITESLNVDQLTEPLTNITENLPEIPGIDKIKPE